MVFKRDMRQYIVLLNIMVCVLVGHCMPVLGQEKEEKILDETELKQLFWKDKETRYSYLFLQAACKRLENKPHDADSLLQRCLEIKPKVAEVYYMQGQLLAAQKKDTLALQKFEKAALLCPTNIHYQERVAQYYVGTGAYNKAINTYEHIYTTHHERSDVLYILAQLYQQQKDYDKVLSVIERMEQVEGKSAELTLTKMNIYETKGDKEKAYKTLKKLTKDYPLEVDYRVMLGNWMIQNNKQKKAYKIFAEAYHEEPNNISVLASLYDYYQLIGEKQKAEDLQNRMLLNKNTPVETKLALIKQVIAHNEEIKGDSTEVLNLFNKVIKNNPKDTDIALMEVAYMHLKKMPTDTIKTVLRHIIDVAPDVSEARLNLLQIILSQQNWKELIEVCQQGTQFTPNEMVYYFYLAWAYLQKGDQHKAIDALKRGISAINDKSDAGLVSEFFAMMGDLLHKQGDKTGAYAAYDKCLQWKSDNINCLNNYAYFLSQDAKRLDKAEQMSYKTIKAEPNNATYLDTYAWILFLQERYAEAKLYINQALRNDTDTVQSAVIIDHAGDIYAMTGQIDKALKYWKQALKMVDKNEQAWIERKIKQKKYIKK